MHILKIYDYSSKNASKTYFFRILVEIKALGIGIRVRSLHQDVPIKHHMVIRDVISLPIQNNRHSDNESENYFLSEDMWFSQSGSLNLHPQSRFARGCESINSSSSSKSSAIIQLIVIVYGVSAGL